MWNKLTHFVKRNADVEGDGDDESRRYNENDPFAASKPNASVMSRVYEQHPNLSVFHSGPVANLVSPSPPASPSKGSRRSIFKRSFKAKLTSTPAAQGKGAAEADTLSPASSVWPSPSPINLIPKKLRASLQIDTFAAQLSNTEPAPLSAPLPSRPHTPTEPERRFKGTPSTRSEVLPAGTGSIRSILRDHNTPGTGQNVRFFSRDAYRVISPDVSEEIAQEAIQGLDPALFLEKLQLASPDNSATQMSGDPTKDHLPPTGSPDNVQDIFSPPRPDALTKSRKPLPFQPRHPPRTSNTSDGSSRSHSHSDSGSLSGLSSRPQSPAMMSTPPAHISATMYFTPDASQSQATDGTPFFTLEAATSPSPAISEPNAPDIPSVQVNAVPVSEDNIVASLHEQLALQRQLVSQFEVDLGARDELVSLLTTQLRSAEAGAEKYRQEVERRQGAMRALRRKVSELEKICRGLEEEVERSREESFERSIMDEASEGALVVLHGSIGQLKAELEKAKEDETKARQDCDELRCETENFGHEKQRLEETQGELKELLESKNLEIKQLEDKVHEASQAESQAKQTIESLQTGLGQKEQAMDEERERHSLVESQWTEEKASLLTRLEAHVSGQDVRHTDIEDLRRKLNEKEEEAKMLKAEVEAQWAHAEKADEKIKLLEGEKEGLSKSIQTLHSKIEELGSQWKEDEGKRAELEDELNEAWASKQEIEQERDHLIEDVNFEREHAEQLTQTLLEQTSKLVELEQERGYALENVSRLEELLRTRDAEIAEAQSRIVEREHEAEELRAQMSKMKWEHNRSVDEQGRHLDEIAQQEKVARKDMEEAVREKVEYEVALGSTKERLSTLTDQVDRLRRQVHDLQQESADKEVKLLQLTKARELDREDKEGLNIALDSKQQELELLKRKLGVKGTGGSTPVPSRIGQSDLASRRQSVAFATPSAPRPRARPSSATGISTLETPLKMGLSTSSSLRPATSTVKPARMGPPPARGSTPLSASTSSLTRSTSSKPRSSLPVTSTPHRKSSSVASSIASEKENAAPVKTPTMTKRSMVPA